MIKNKNYNPPGIVWVILIVIAVTGIEYFQTQLPGDPLIWQFLLVGLMAVLKQIKVEDIQLKAALEVINSLRNQILGKQTRSGKIGVGVDETAYIEPSMMDDKTLGVPEPRSKTSRLLWG